jgi:hypothetical protein
MDDIPDISKTQATYLKQGTSPVPDKFVEIAQRKNAAADVSSCFAINIIPNIPKSSLNMVLDGVLSLIQDDASIGKTTQKSFQRLRKEKAPADFLAEAFILAVQTGQNKVDYSMEVSDELTPVLKDVDLIQAKLNALPKVKPIEPPKKPGASEQRYIGALFEAYDDASTESNPPSEDITKYPKYDKDLKQRRIEFFAAEAVRRGTRENFHSNNADNLFGELMSETLSGIADIHAMDYKHGYARLLSVMNHATVLHLDKCILGRIPEWVGANQKKGVCHMLVNDGQIKGWVDDDD